MKKRLLTLLTMFSVAGLMAQPCSELFISEYIEGSSFNKAVEIYNPTSSPVNLSNYSLILQGFSSSGNPFTNTPFDFPNINLAPGAVYVIAHTQANATILGIADTTNDDVANFNGNDALIFMNGNDTVDVFGMPGTNPGTNWTVGAGASSEFTLVRMTSVQEGTTNWIVGATQWNSSPQNTTSNLGMHTMTACAPVTDTIVKFTPSAGSYGEGQSFNLTATLVNPSPVTSFTVQAVLKSGTAADINNYTTQTLTFTTNGSSASTSITITDDVAQEGAEVLTFALRNPFGGMILGNDSIFTLTIGASDQPSGPVYPIGTVRGNDTNGVPDSINVACQVAGVVYGVNTRSTGLQFFINDHTGGIGVFSPSSNFGYTVTEGDSILVKGQVDAFNGFGQMSFIDTIEFISAANPIQAPQVVTVLDESTESELVRINNCTLVNASQWTNSAAGFNVDITNGSTTYQMRIAPNTTAVSMPVPSGVFHVIGMGSQFDASSPFDQGYQIQPRWAEDIIPFTGVDDESSVSVTVFPNPTKGQINISLAEGVDNGTVMVRDLTGKVVYTQQLNDVAGGQTISFSIGDKANGVYLVEVKGDSFRSTRKVVLNK